MSHLDPFDNPEVLPLASCRTGDPPELPALDLVSEFVPGGDNPEAGPKASQASRNIKDPSGSQGDLHSLAPLRLNPIS